MKLLRQVARLLTPVQRRRYLKLLGILLVSGVMQVLGVASVAPFVALLSRPELIHSNRLIRWMYDVSGATNDTRFLILFALLLMAMIGAIVLARRDVYSSDVITGEPADQGLIEKARTPLLTGKPSP